MTIHTKTEDVVLKTALSAEAGIRRRFRAVASRTWFSILAGASDLSAVMASVFAIGWIYHMGVLGEEPYNETLVHIGLTVALLFVLPNAMRHEYGVGNFLSFAGHARRSFQLWNLAFVAAIVLGFMTKTSLSYSRGTVALFYLGGFLAVIGVRYLLVRIVRTGSKTGTVSARRIFLVGFEEEILAFASRHQPWNLGMEVTGVQVLPRGQSAEKSADALAEACRRARALAPDDVFILMSWDNKPTIDAAIDRFLTIPASIHLGADPLLDRFHDLRLSRIGTVASVQLVRKPMTAADVAAKRAFDAALAAAALLVLAPLFALIALAIRLDSRGPVMFLQRRYGFNQRPFRIFKFRTMTTLDDGEVVQQAMKHDPRITRVGRFLRRWNLDELPQLVNVLKGEMSLVGPRPHALAHDHEFERRIALYARRHNVKPGITGLAQVNGLRGETSTDEKMRRRVEMDLEYIDNWSMILDLKILLQTVFSPKAYRNAG